MEEGFIRKQVRVLIIGATGLLGRVLMQQWDSGEAAGVGSKEGDIRDPAQVQQLFARFRPECTILAAAYADVDGCERDPDRAYAVNRDGAVNVARAARDTGSRLIFLSTDYVFDGSKTTPYEPDDPVAPLSVYARSKVEAEARLREILPSCCIARTSWIFGASGAGFANAILERAQSQKKLAVVNDQRGGPSFNRDLARALRLLIAARAEGTVHVSNGGDCSRYEFACELIKAAGLADVSVEPASSSQFPRPARRPVYSVLSIMGLQKYGISMRQWRETLGDYIQERRKATEVPAISI